MWYSHTADINYYPIFILFKTFLKMSTQQYISYITQRCVSLRNCYQYSSMIITLFQVAYYWFQELNILKVQMIIALLIFKNYIFLVLHTNFSLTKLKLNLGRYTSPRKEGKLCKRPRFNKGYASNKHQRKILNNQ